jgi:NAD(P)-dependent dehydrogenase (short-subunit alcohol dehydrogenase family)
MPSLSGKKTVITGGSSGIGKAIARAYLAEGAEVWIASRDAAAVKAAVAELGAKSRGSVIDVADEASVAKFAKELRTEWGSIDVLVNGAGIYGPIGIVSEVEPKAWLAALTVNLYGTFLMTHAMVPLIPKGGSIINFVGGGEGAYPHFSSYVAAKGGVARFTETVAAELQEKGIAVNAFAPGPVNTKFLDDLLAAGPEKAGRANYERALKQKKEGGVSPEKAAALCIWLASDAARGLTGKILSAVWDEYEKFPERMKEIMGTDVYAFRRVRPGDRGFEWERD